MDLSFLKIAKIAIYKKNSAKKTYSSTPQKVQIVARATFSFDTYLFISSLLSIRFSNLIIYLHYCCACTTWFFNLDDW